MDAKKRPGWSTSTRRSSGKGKMIGDSPIHLTTLRASTPPFFFFLESYMCISFPSSVALRLLYMIIVIVHNARCSFPLNRPRDTQIPNLPQHLLDPTIQMSLRIHLPRVCIEILLHLRHARICLGAKPQLDLNEGLETGVQIRHAQIDQLR